MTAGEVRRRMDRDINSISVESLCGWILLVGFLLVFWPAVIWVAWRAL